MYKLSSYFNYISLTIKIEDIYNRVNETLI